MKLNSFVQVMMRVTEASGSITGDETGVIGAGTSITASRRVNPSRSRSRQRGASEVSPSDSLLLGKAELLGQIVMPGLV